MMQSMILRLAMDKKKDPSMFIRLLKFEASFLEWSTLVEIMHGIATPALFVVFQSKKISNE